MRRDRSILARGGSCALEKAWRRRWSGKCSAQPLTRGPEERYNDGCWHGVAHDHAARSDACFRFASYATKVGRPKILGLDVAAVHMQVVQLTREPMLHGFR